MPNGPKPKLAPNPGYDRPASEPKPRTAPPAEVYPKPFISQLKGKGTINKNAQSQMERALKEQ